MRHQSVRDRLHEGEGMVRHEMGHHSEHHMQHRDGHHSSHSIYKNEVEKPELAAMGHMVEGMGCNDYKNDADPIAYGQSSSVGMKSDERKIHAQFKEYHWD